MEVNGSSLHSDFEEIHLMSWVGVKQLAAFWYSLIYCKYDWSSYAHIPLHKERHAKWSMWKLASILLSAALGHIDSVCDTIGEAAEKIKSWPDLSGIQSGLESVYDKLKPILDFFDKVEDALKKEICIPDITEQEFIEYVIEASTTFSLDLVSRLYSGKSMMGQDPFSLQLHDNFSQFY